MKWYHILIIVALFAIAYFLGYKGAKEKFAVSTSTITTNQVNYKPFLDSLIMAQMQVGKQADILRGIAIGYQKDNVLLNAELIRINELMSKYVTQIKDTARSSPNISIKLPDSLFRQSAPIIIEKNKPYYLEIKDSTIALSANISRDSLTLTKIEIPNTLIINDEVFSINDEKQIRTTTISNSNPLLNTKPTTVINQNWSEKGIQKQRRKAFYRGAGIGTGLAILLGLFLK
jgi:hypothetical protein